MPQSSQFFDITYRGFQIDELHHHNQNLVGTLHKGVPTVVYQDENCCKMTISPELITDFVVGKNLVEADV